MCTVSMPGLQKLTREKSKIWTDVSTLKAGVTNLELVPVSFVSIFWKITFVSFSASLRH